MSPTIIYLELRYTLGTLYFANYVAKNIVYDDFTAPEGYFQHTYAQTPHLKKQYTLKI